MTYDERVALNQKYASRSVLEELAFESEYHKATMSKNEAEFIRWLCGRAYELLKARKPRLLTAQDFKDNPDVDAQGYLPCWVECNEKERASAIKCGILEPGEDMDGWSEACVDELPGGAAHNPNIRLWTTKPTDDQKKSIPWPDMPVASKHKT